MIDEFADFILQLNEKARELLESATNLDTELDDKLGAPDQDRLARIQELMNKLCSGMTRVVQILEAPSSAPDRFFAYTCGMRMLPDVADALGEFVKSHGTTAPEHGVPYVERIIGIAWISTITIGGGLRGCEKIVCRGIANRS